MPSTINGDLTDLLALLPTRHNIASSTNASPIVVTTSTSHGCTTGDRVVVFGHLVNTAANGSNGWEVVVLSPTTLELVGSTGNGVGGATGVLGSAAFGSQITIPSAGDPRKVVSVNVAFEALADRTALLLYQLSYNQKIHAGGAVEFESGAALVFDAETVIISTDPTGWNGPLRIESGSRFSWYPGSIGEWASGANLDMYGTETIKSGGTWILDEGSTGSVWATLTVENNGTTKLGKIDVNTGATVTIKPGAILVMNGTMSVATAGAGFVSVGTGGIVTLASGSVVNLGSTTNITGPVNMVGAVVDIDDASTITTRGPIVHSGDDAFEVLRSDNTVPDASNFAFDAWKQDQWFVDTLTADRILKLTTPPGGAKVRTRFTRQDNGTIAHALGIRDASSTNVLTLGGSGYETNISGTNLQWCDMYYNGTAWVTCAGGGA